MGGLLLIEHHAKSGSGILQKFYNDFVNSHALSGESRCSRKRALAVRVPLHNSSSDVLSTSQLYSH
jgi:hypothetical protein